MGGEGGVGGWGGVDRGGFMGRGVFIRYHHYIMYEGFGWSMRGGVWGWVVGGVVGASIWRILRAWHADLHGFGGFTRIVWIW